MDISQFACPVCQEIPTERPFLKCKNNHKLCDNCFDKLELKACPIGRCGFSTPPKRDFHLLEIIRANIADVTCKFSANGCKFKGHGDALLVHEKHCALIAYVTCNKCLEIPRNGKLLCCSGAEAHNICGPCFQKLPAPKICPLDNVPCVLPLKKNLDAEQFILQGNFDFPCMNKQFGCTTTGQRKVIIEHEGKCAFKQYPCPDRSCSHLMPKQNILVHLKENHPSAEWVKHDSSVPGTALSQTFLLSDDSLVCQSCDWPLVIVECCGTYIFLNLVKKSHTFHAWASTLDETATAGLKVNLSVCGSGYRLSVDQKPPFIFDALEKKVFFQAGDLFFCERLAKLLKSSGDQPGDCSRIVVSFEVFAKSGDEASAPGPSGKGMNVNESENQSLAQDQHGLGSETGHVVDELDEASPNSNAESVHAEFHGEEGLPENGASESEETHRQDGASDDMGSKFGVVFSAIRAAFK